MKPPVEGWVRIRTKDVVAVPTPDGKGIAARIPVVVSAWKDHASGQIYYDSEARQLMDDVKARHLGLLLPSQMLELRRVLGCTQQEMASLLQLGAKTWTRWETGRERPSRSMNVLLMALHDARIDADYLRELQKRQAGAGLAAKTRLDYTHLPPHRHASQRVAEPKADYGQRERK